MKLRCIDLDKVSKLCLLWREIFHLPSLVLLWFKYYDRQHKPLFLSCNESDSKVYVPLYHYKRYIFDILQSCAGGYAWRTYIDYANLGMDYIEFINALHNCNCLPKWNMFKFNNVSLSEFGLFEKALIEKKSKYVILSDNHIGIVYNDENFKRFILEHYYSKKHRNIRNRYKRIFDNDIVVEKHINIKDEKKFADVYRDILSVEDGSWKACVENNMDNPKNRDYYAGIFALMRNRGNLSIYLLKCKNKPLSFLITYQDSAVEGKVILFKTAYVSEYPSLSPGNYIFYEYFLDVIKDKKIKKIDCAAWMPYMSKWRMLKEHYVTVALFNNDFKSYIFYLIVKVVAFFTRIKVGLLNGKN